MANGGSIVLNDSWWRNLANFWTLVCYAGVIFDFLENGAFQYYIAPILIIYVSILAIYSGLKEFERWHDFHEGRHPGEFFVIGWTALIIGLVLAGYLMQRPYRVPGEIISTYIAVLGVLAITQKSKSLRQRR